MLVCLFTILCITHVIANQEIFLADELIELHNGHNLMGLNKLLQVNPMELDCDKNLLHLGSTLEMWEDLYKHEHNLNEEIHVLEHAKSLLQKIEKHHHGSKAQIKRTVRKVLVQLRKDNHKKLHHLIKTWRHEEIESLQKQVHFLQTRAANSEECCDKIEKLLDKYLEERKKMREQCKNKDITINIINDKEKQVEIIKHQCGLKYEEDGNVHIKEHHGHDKHEEHEERNIIVGGKDSLPPHLREEKKEVVVEKKEIIVGGKDSLPPQEVKKEIVIEKVEEKKPEPKPEVKPEPKPEVKPEPKPEVKPEPKPEVKPEPKPEVKPETKETKPPVLDMDDEEEEEKEIVIKSASGKAASQKGTTEGK